MLQHHPVGKLKTAPTFKYLSGNQEGGERKTHSVCPWKTLTEWMDGSLKSHSLKVVSLDEVTTSRWVGWVQQ